MEEISDLCHVIPPQQERSARFLKRVLEAAEQVLRRDGVEGLTMPGVALEAGVSVGGIYRRFQTKQDLLRAIKDRHLTRSEQAVDAAMDAPLGSLAEAVDSFLAALFHGDGSGDLFGLIMDSQAEDSVMRARGQDAVEKMRAALVRALAPFRAEIRHPEPDLAVDMAFMIALSVLMRRLKGKMTPGAPTRGSVLRRELGRTIRAYLLAADT